MNIKRLSIGVIIDAHGACNALEQCIMAVMGQSSLPDTVVIIDSADTPRITDPTWLPTLTGSVTAPMPKVCYRHNAPTAVTDRRSAGLALTTDDIIYWLDGTIVIEHTFIQEMQRVFAGHPCYGGGTGVAKTTNKNNSFLQTIARRILLVGQPFEATKYTCFGMPYREAEQPAFGDIGCAHQYCSAYRRCMYERASHRRAYGNSIFYDIDIAQQWRTQQKIFLNPYAQYQYSTGIPSNAPLNIAEEQALSIQRYTTLFFARFYPARRMSLVPYCWSMLGLFIAAITSTVVAWKLGYIVGYLRGLQRAIRAARHKRS